MFRYDSNGAYSSGIGEMKIDLMLAELNGLMGWHPAHAVISPHRRDIMRVNPHRLDYFVVEIAHRSTNFTPPVTHAWG